MPLDDETRKLLEGLQRCASEKHGAPEPKDSPWKTTHAWATLFGFQNAHTGRLLNDGVDAGTWEVSMRRGLTRSGKVRTLKHYRPVK